ncbi:MAG: TetR/AcrR family transcriptional regulator [Acidimicrobiia bacterium]|jgi:AcrR family transcriptional regulator
MPAAVTARGRRTRERLLEATAELVAERGFHAVGIADIGAAAGVTGSAIYRHFPSKQDILVALLDRVVDDLLSGARTVVADAATPEAALDGLLRAHVDFALRDRALIRVYDQEADHLPDADRARLRRTQRAYADEWVGVLARVRPDLSAESGRAAVHATFGLVNSVADYRSPLLPDDLRALLLAMAHSALSTPRPDASRAMTHPTVRTGVRPGGRRRPR